MPNTAPRNDCGFRREGVARANGARARPKPKLVNSPASEPAVRAGSRARREGRASWPGAIVTENVRFVPLPATTILCAPATGRHEDQVARRDRRPRCPKTEVAARHTRSASAPHLGLRVGARRRTRRRTRRGVAVRPRCRSAGGGLVTANAVTVGALPVTGGKPLGVSHAARSGCSRRAE